MSTKIIHKKGLLKIVSTIYLILFKEAEEMSNMRDVAKKAGVSITTVSRILSYNTNHKTKEETKIKVWKAAAELNYVLPERSAHMPDINTFHGSWRIGCILNSNLDNFADPFYHSVVEGVRTHLAKQNLALVEAFEGRNIDNSDLQQKILDANLDAIIIYNIVSSDFYDELMSKIPVVVCVADWLQWGDHDLIAYDHFEAVRLALEHLVIKGHKRIGYIGGPEFSGDYTGSMKTEPRYRAYKEIMEFHNLTIQSEWVKNCYWSRKICRQEVIAILDTDERPTAILAGSDNMAAIVLNTLYELHIRVPEDIAVIGICDLMFARYTTPPLTTVHVPAEEMGQFAAQLVLMHLKGELAIKKHFFFPVSLVERSST